MKILIAADSFKGSCSSLEVAQYVGEGIHSVCSDAEVLSVGIADGGEGTMETLTQALHGTFITCPAHDALMRPIQSRYGWLETEHLAILDMAETNTVKINNASDGAEVMDNRKKSKIRKKHDS